MAFPALGAGGYRAAMPEEIPEVLRTLERIPQLAEAQCWLVTHRARVFRARRDGEDQTVEIEVSLDQAGRSVCVARDDARGLVAHGVPMPGLNGAISMVPWYVLDDDPVPEKIGHTSSAPSV